MKPHQRRYELGLALRTSRALLTVIARTAVRHGRDKDVAKHVARAQRSAVLAARALCAACAVKLGGAK